MKSSVEQLELADRSNQYNFEFENLLIEHSGTLLIQHLKGPNVLELGCGKGLVTKKLTDSGCNVTSVDASQYFIDMASRQAPHANYVCSTWQNFDYSLESYSDLVLFRALDTLDNPEGLLQLIRDQITSPVRMHVLITNVDSIHRLAAKQFKLESKDEISPRATTVGRKQAFNAQSILELIKSCGFTIIERTGVGIKPLNNIQMDELPNQVLQSLSETGHLLGDHASEVYVVSEI